MMNRNHDQSQLQLGSTFYPGGYDDFNMPEVISPAPQRHMQEVPGHIQENLAHLELDATPKGSLSGLQSPVPMSRDQFPSGSQSAGRNGPSSNIAMSLSQQHTRTPDNYSPGGSEYNQGYADQDNQLAVDQPSFSPFPQMTNRSATVPPSAEEKESILEDARVEVLNSNDPEVQLIWAQDALAYVEVAMQNEQRLSEYQSSRSHTPRVEHQLRVDATNVVSFLADQHHPKAEFMRGIWLEFGKFGYRMDKKEAYQSYSRAARKGYARAEYRLGMQFESTNDIPKAIKHYSLGVEAGDAASHYRLGMMTLLGQHGRIQDFHRGVELVRYSADAADENAPQGAYVYGMLQVRELPQVNVPEQFLPLNVSSARYNIEKAAYLGFAKAQTKMGSAYELCQLGCDFDPALSLHYNNLAARQGEPEADMAISKWFLCGYEGVFRKNEELAFTYAKRAAQMGLPTAEFAIGYFFEIGIHVQTNIKEARVWYGKAAEHGNKDAASRIEGISRSKTLSRKDHENIAVAKIRSHRVSQHGVRPPRFTPQVPDMPASPNQYISMPDSGSSYSSYNGSPYPQSAPFDPSPGSAFVSPDLRPISGFSTTPNVRPVSTSTPSGFPMHAQYQNLPPSSSGPQRPYSSMSDTMPSEGRPLPAPRVASSNLRPQPYRHSSSGLPAHPAVNRPASVASMVSNQKPLPALDIGFTAPLDPSGADRVKRLQKSDNPNAGNPRIHDGRTDRKSSRPNPVPANHSYGTNGRMSSPPRTSNTPTPSVRPSRQESMPVRPSLGSNYPSSAPTPPPAKLGASVPPSSRTSSTGGKQPGKGPSTFEEMGVPQGKTEGDCIVM